MSDAVSALAGAGFDGLVRVEEAGLTGMVTLRADLGLKKVARALKAVTGAALPGPLEFTAGAKGRVAWMSPDELLLFVAHEKAPETVARLERALAPSPVLVANVSDLRAVFRVTGPRWPEVLGKLTPADLRDVAPGQFRRTRLGQVAAAFAVVDAQTVEVVCFRSVARYMFDLLSNAAAPGGAVFPD
ncbi:MAG TPA: sarcosine oxidase subunit gamma [Aliiroseovarius sp.]|nr:sarcosine oxidase subunit gamma [Aliiroseovarius sp.]